MRPFACRVLQIQIMGLCEHLNTPVKIEYLDGQDFEGQLGSITLPDTGTDAMVTLLYRCGPCVVLRVKFRIPGCRSVRIACRHVW